MSDIQKEIKNAEGTRHVAETEVQQKTLVKCSKYSQAEETLYTTWARDENATKHYSAAPL